jgi:hypothetical protein
LLSFPDGINGLIAGPFGPSSNGRTGTLNSGFFALLERFFFCAESDFCSVDAFVPESVWGEGSLFEESLLAGVSVVFFAVLLRATFFFGAALAFFLATFFVVAFFAAFLTAFFFTTFLVTFFLVTFLEAVDFRLVEVFFAGAFLAVFFALEVRDDFFEVLFRAVFFAAFFFVTFFFAKRTPSRRIRQAESNPAIRAQE